MMPFLDATNVFDGFPVRIGPKPVNQALQTKEES